MPRKSAASSDIPAGKIYSSGAHGFLAPYASIPEQSRGRLYGEEGSRGRSCYQRDRDRIIHCAAFRRLEYKTQVFVFHEGDHYRTRLTHSLEVAQLARSVARELYLDEDLAEAVALAHDLGHTPFGHAGEEALDAAMQPHGGFDHNAQTIRVLTKLEARYISFPGLNLTWECLEGIAKHNGPLLDKKGRGEVPRALKSYAREHDLALHLHPNLEAQVASVCDDIAYLSHDIEDGLRARLFTPGEVEEVPLAGKLFRDMRRRHKDIAEGVLAHEVRRRLINMMVRDVVARAEETIRAGRIETAADIRALGRMALGFSPEMERNNKAIRAFLHERMYRHYKVNRMTSKARRVIADLFSFYRAEPDCLPSAWRARVAAAEKPEKPAVVADFIAGMTDRFALEEHRRIFDLSYKLIGE